MECSFAGLWNTYRKLQKIKQDAENEGCPVTSSLMDEYLKDYQKKCWMITQVANC